MPSVRRCSTRPAAGCAARSHASSATATRARPALDLRVDLVPAILTFRVLIGDEPMDPDDTVRQLVTLILGEHSTDESSSVSDAS